VFIYDGIPGGAGLSKQAFTRAERLLEYTLDVVRSCQCEFGCPSCVHSPKCGSGNRPIDKAAACYLLESIREAHDYETMMKNGVKQTETEIFDGNSKVSEGQGDDFDYRRINLSQVQEIVRKRTSGISHKHSLRLKRRRRKRTASRLKIPVVTEKSQQNIHFGVFDVETQRSAQEVGGWHRADLMGISCAVVYDSKSETFFEYLEDQVPLLIEHLKRFELVIGFNIKRFDFHVLGGYSDFDFRELQTIDILEDVHKRLGYRLSLDHLASVTLGRKKTADGLQALKWWKQGRTQEIIDYCKADVKITRDLYRYGQKNGYLLFMNKAKNTVRLPVDW
jgi:DEAD/DEAH box helicase domain-containing protein